MIAFRTTLTLPKVVPSVTTIKTAQLVSLAASLVEKNVQFFASNARTPSLPARASREFLLDQSVSC